MAAQVEFVAFGVPAEIVVIIENEDAAICGRVCAIKVRGGETADAATDDDQIVFLSGIRRRRPGTAIAQRMSVLEGAGVAAAQAGEQRRVVAECVLGCLVRWRCREQRCGCGGGDSHGDAVQKIPPRDGLIHAEEAVTGAILFFLRHWIPVKRHANYRAIDGLATL
jgi:hypothetical protein